MSFDVEEVALRSGASADWSGSEAPVLAAGELGLDTDTGEVRRGDGSSAWSALKSVSPARVSVTLVGGTKATADTSIKAGSVVVPVVKTLGTVSAPKTMRVSYSNGVSFTVTSEDATDTSTLDCLVWH